MKNHCIRHFETTQSDKFHLKYKEHKVNDLGKMLVLFQNIKLEKPKSGQTVQIASSKDFEESNLTNV